MNMCKLVEKCKQRAILQAGKDAITSGKSSHVFTPRYVRDDVSGKTLGVEIMISYDADDGEVWFTVYPDSSVYNAFTKEACADHFIELIEPAVVDGTINER
jgi:hypothetical protein